MKKVMRWLVILLMSVGSLVSLIHFAPIAYKAIGLAQSLQRQGTPSSQQDGFALLMCILVVASLLISIKSFPMFLRETWNVIPQILKLIRKAIKKIAKPTKRSIKKMRLTRKEIRMARRKHLESLSSIELEKKMRKRLKKRVHNLPKDQRMDIFDSLTGLSLEDLQDLIPTVWNGMV